MPYSLYEIGSAIFSRSGEQASANALVEAIHTHGLGLTVELTGAFTPVDADERLESLGGAETEGNLRQLQNYLNQLRNLSLTVTKAQFSQNILGHVQEGNRSVESSLRNLNTGVNHMLEFIRAFVGKDVKHPIRYLAHSVTRTDYGMADDLEYAEEETGTYHTLQRMGNNQSWHAWGTYLEDTPTLRRYIRYVDSIATRSGMRVVYAPKVLTHAEELTGTPTRPSWHVVDGRVERVIQTGQNPIRILFVSLSFDHNLFAPLTVIETDAQPGQRPRNAEQMDYSPIFVDNLSSIVKVLTTIGSFAACKIYYKGLRNSARSSQAAPSS